MRYMIIAFTLLSAVLHGDTRANRGLHSIPILVDAQFASANETRIPRSSLNRVILHPTIGCADSAWTVDSLSVLVLLSPKFS